MSRAVRAVLQAVRRAWRALGRVPAMLLVLAALATAVMYCSNDLQDKEPAAPRGDGKYRPVMARGDGHMHFLITRSLVFDRDMNFDNDLARFGDPWRQPTTVTGRKNVMQQIGPSLVWAPVLAIAHGAAVIANLFGADIPTHGYTLFHQRILYSTSVLFAWLAIALGVFCAVRLVGGRWGPAIAGVAVLLGTSLTYYATYMPSYAHAMDAAACAGFLGYWICTFQELRWRRYVVLGVLLGVAAMVRVQDLGFGIVVAIEVVVVAWNLRVRSESSRAWLRAAGGLVARGAVVLAIAILLHVPQFYEWKQLYGSWLTTPQGPGQMRYATPLVLELLFSSRNGWFSTHPIAYLGTLGLVVGAISGPRLGPRTRVTCLALLASIAIQIYFNSITYEWWSGASFGQRRMCSVSLPLVIGLAVLMQECARIVRTRLPRVRGYVQYAIAISVFGYLVAWNLVWTGALRNGVPAGRDNRPTCCIDVPRPLKWIAQPIYRAIGNPFELPASGLFAARHGVSLQRWDVAVGMYPLVPGVLGYQDGSYRRATATWDVAGPGGAPYLLDGWSKSHRDATRTVKVWRWTRGRVAEMMVPLLMPEPHLITIPLAANVPDGESMEVVIRWNGSERLRTRIAAAWTTVQFTTDDEVGTGIVAIESEPAPFRGTSRPDAPSLQPGVGAVGVAVGPLRIGLP